ncbi:hypothetical protein [Pararhizobium qamdonense]|uniref:hypothetical protein n=1 Tax=Pararhizobium qamdonense TaxID=3031126 RepID=UPI0023E2B034|nr:hypothetical protein [Pararhizobium qamdonense]
MNVVTFEPPPLYDIASVRNAAADLKTALVYLRSMTLVAVSGVRRATTIDEMVMRYATWLGHWHRCGVGNTYAMHFRGVVIADGRLVVAALQVKSEITSINEAVGQPVIWMSVPDRAALRINIIDLLTNANASLDIALESCAILEGHNLTEGTSA